MLKGNLFSISHFFQSEISLKVVQLIVELIRDNRKIVDRISKVQINQFVEALRTNEVTFDYRHDHLFDDDIFRTIDTWSCWRSSACVMAWASSITKRISLKDGSSKTEWLAFVYYISPDHQYYCYVIVNLDCLERSLPDGERPEHSRTTEHTLCQYRLHEIVGGTPQIPSSNFIQDLERNIIGITNQVDYPSYDEEKVQFLLAQLDLFNAICYVRFIDRLLRYWHIGVKILTYTHLRVLGLVNYS